MKAEDVTECPSCQGHHFHETVTCTDHTATHEVFHVKHCERCGLGITSPRPPVSEAGRYYASTQYISHAATSRSFFDTIYLIIRRFTVRRKFQLIKPFLSSHGLLDYGCGTGAFLHEVGKHHARVLGVEPSAEARKNSSTPSAIVPSLEELPPGPFDVITLWHVIEHVYPLKETLRQLKQKLADSGAIFIAVPNYLSADAKQYGKHWAAYDVPRHLWHFSPQSMATFLQGEGLRVTQILPMKLDAFYVSLLSERYAHPEHSGVIRVLRALWNGFRSNLAARRGTNYSSLIFVVQK